MKCRICKRPVENTLYTPAPDIHGSCAIEADRGRLHPTLTPDTPSTEARHDPFCVMFGINDLMRGKESGCTCATRRPDTPSTEALTPEAVFEAVLIHLPYTERPAFREQYKRAVRQEAADTSGRGTIRIRTPDDKPGTWTAWSDLVPGMPYTYSSGDVAVTVDWKAADTSGADVTTALTALGHIERLAQGRISWAHIVILVREARAALEGATE